MLYLVSVTNIHKIMRKTERLIEKLLVCFIKESMITRMEVFLNKKEKLLNKSSPKWLLYIIVLSFFI